jgi:hypothetical protein
VLVRNHAHRFRQIREVSVRQHEVAQWVTDPGIESSRNQHQAGLESVSGGQQLLLKCSQNFFAAGTRGKWAVERGPLSRAFAGFIRGAGAGIPRILMRAEEEDGAIGVENILRANQRSARGPRRTSAGRSEPRRRCC